MYYYVNNLSTMFKYSQLPCVSEEKKRMEKSNIRKCGFKITVFSLAVKRDVVKLQKTEKILSNFLGCKL